MQTTWGSREGADTDDEIRLSRVPEYEEEEMEEDGMKTWLLKNAA